LAKINQPLPESPELGEARQFLRLLEDVTQMQELLLDEASALRARVLELEAKARMAAVRHGRQA
jgi:hypothetical protein